MRSGRLRNRIEVVKQAGRDSFGGISDEYELVAKIRAEIKVLTDVESASNRVSNNLTTEFKVRYNRRIEKPTADMFIRFKDEYYDIISVINFRELNKFMTITAVKRG